MQNLAEGSSESFCCKSIQKIWTTIFLRISLKLCVFVKILYNDHLQNICSMICIQVFADASFQHLEIPSQGLTSLPFDQINIIWNSLLLSRSESSHHHQHCYQRRHHLRHVCVRLFRQWQSSASASGRVARALFLTLCSSSSFSSHFVGV